MLIFQPQNLYDISYATAKSVKGPYTKAQYPVAPFLVTGNSGYGLCHEGLNTRLTDFNYVLRRLTAPGGAMPLPDGSLIAFHATTSSDPLIRPMYISRPTWTSSSVAP